MVGVFSVMQPVDDAVLAFFQGVQHPFLDAFFSAVTHLGNPLFWVLVVAGIYWEGREDDGFFLMNAILFSSAVTGFAKDAIARLRPDVSPRDVFMGSAYTDYAFPSGHASLIGAMTGFLWRSVKRFYRAVLVVAVLLVALSRLYLGYHFFSDVAAGLLLGYAIGVVNYHLKKTWKTRKFRLSRLGDEVALVIVIVIALAALAFLNQLPLIAGMLGFYAGFFASKELRMEPFALKRHHLRVKWFLGFAGLFVLLVVPMAVPGLSGLETFLVYFVGGLWISFVYPWIYDNLVHHLLL